MLNIFGEPQLYKDKQREFYCYIRIVICCLLLNLTVMPHGETGLSYSQHLQFLQASDSHQQVSVSKHKAFLNTQNGLQCMVIFMRPYSLDPLLIKTIATIVAPFQHRLVVQLGVVPNQHAHEDMSYVVSKSCEPS